MLNTKIFKSTTISRLTSTAFHAAARLSRGATSIIKTEALRMDRLPDAEYEARLTVCRNCPGQHATFNKDGKLHTCGEMIASLKKEGKTTCGCILRHKARDTKEQCPFDYWPTVKSITRLRVNLASRRSFLVRTGAIFGALAIAPVKALAANSDVTRYISISACNNGGSAQWVKCSEGCGEKVNKVFQATDGNCYKLGSAVKPGDGSSTPPPGKKTDVQEWVTDCNDTKCQAPCDLKDGSQINGNDCDGNPTQSGVPYARHTGGCWYKLETSYIASASESIYTGGPYPWNCAPTPQSPFSGEVRWRQIDKTWEPIVKNGEVSFPGAIYLNTNTCEWKLSLSNEPATKATGSSPAGAYEDGLCTPADSTTVGASVSS